MSVVNVIDWAIQRWEQGAKWLKEKNRRDTNEKIDDAVDSHDSKRVDAILRKIEQDRKARINSKN